MNFMTKIGYCLKSADAIEQEWATIRAEKRELASERQKNQAEIENMKKDVEYQKKMSEEDVKKRIIQLDLQTKTVEELQQKLIQEKKDLEPAWQAIRDEKYSIFTEKKSISNTWKAINDEWQKIMDFHPELKQELKAKNIAAIMSQEHSKESFNGIDPEIIEKMHQKDMKTVSGGEETVRYIRKDHPYLHGHKE